MKIMIMGATGKAGSNIVRELKAKGVRPTAAVRDIEKAKAKLGDGVDYVYFDYTDPATYGPALEGVDRLFSIAPPPKKDPAVMRDLMKVVKEKGVKFVLFQSGRTSSSKKGKPLYEIEQDLSNDPNVCIMRPGLYMQNFHDWLGTTIPDGELCLPLEDAKVAMLDVKDLGAAAAAILTTDGHGGKQYNVTSNEALDHGRVADILSGAMGRRIVYSKPDSETYVKRMVEKGWNEDGARYSVVLFDLIKNKSTEAEVTNVFQNLVGREPRSFAEVAREEFGA